jgi:hypothetical protein
MDRRLDDVEKIKFLNLEGIELRPLRRPARIQSLLNFWILFMFNVKFLFHEQSTEAEKNKNLQVKYFCEISGSQSRNYYDFLLRRDSAEYGR